MRQRISEAGEGKIGCIFWLIIGLIAALFGAKMVPIKLSAMKLEDHMQELTMSQRARTAGGDWFQHEIYKKARELKLDIPKKQIRAKKYPERVVMDVEFTKPIDVFLFTYDWTITIHIDRDVFWF